ncbi:hypothetical protein K1719_032035 [Acacia pycnantha]|nr:hypothetical protein K1719_032035 [Acacia pycnantha]
MRQWIAAEAEKWIDVLTSVRLLKPRLFLAYSWQVWSSITDKAAITMIRVCNIAYITCSLIQVSVPFLHHYPTPFGFLLGTW